MLDKFHEIPCNVYFANNFISCVSFECTSKYYVSHFFTHKRYYFHSYVLKSNTVSLQSDYVITNTFKTTKRTQDKTNQNVVKPK